MRSRTDGECLPCGPEVYGIPEILRAQYEDGGCSSAAAAAAAAAPAAAPERPTAHRRSSWDGAPRTHAHSENGSAASGPASCADARAQLLGAAGPKAAAALKEEDEEVAAAAFAMQALSAAGGLQLKRLKTAPAALSGSAVVVAAVPGPIPVGQLLVAATDAAVSSARAAAAAPAQQQLQQQLAAPGALPGGGGEGIVHLRPQHSTPRARRGAAVAPAVGALRLPALSTGAAMQLQQQQQQTARTVAPPAGAAPSSSSPASLYLPLPAGGAVTTFTGVPLAATGRAASGGLSWLVTTSAGTGSSGYGGGATWPIMAASRSASGVLPGVASAAGSSGTGTLQPLLDAVGGLVHDRHPAMQQLGWRAQREVDGVARGGATLALPAATGAIAAAAQQQPSAAAVMGGLLGPAGLMQVGGFADAPAAQPVDGLLALLPSLESVQRLRQAHCCADAQQRGLEAAVRLFV